MQHEYYDRLKHSTRRNTYTSNDKDMIVKIKGKYHVVKKKNISKLINDFVRHGKNKKLKNGQKLKFKDISCQTNRATNQQANPDTGVLGNHDTAKIKMDTNNYSRWNCDSSFRMYDAQILPNISTYRDTGNSSTFERWTECRDRPKSTSGYSSHDTYKFKLPNLKASLTIDMEEVRKQAQCYFFFHAERNYNKLEHEGVQDERSLMNDVYPSTQ